MVNNLDPKMLERVRNELELQEATERAIVLGKEIAMMLDKEKPVTKCLIANVLFKQFTKQFPAVFDAFRKLGL
jgi:hypothetical protein